jgi:ribosomal protein S18 acetylase RimI-like enzyme
MQFELTEALIDDILFAMEDQAGDFRLDTVEAAVTGGLDDLDFLDEDPDADHEADGEDCSRYISLPEWDSSDGFRLMEHFAARLRNPIVRDELTSALSLGRGVFRAFKDTLARYPETEKLWFSFKDMEMKNEIIRWYNGLREEWGLEKIGMEPEETDDLVLEDFRIRPLLKEDIFQVEELHNRCLEEYKNTMVGTGVGISFDYVLKETQALRKQFIEDGLVAESRNGEVAGYISGEKTENVFVIQNLEVKPEFRGLGIGETLLTKLLESLDPKEIDQVLLDLPSGTEGFSRVLHRESFKPYMVRYWLRLRDRE